MTCISIRARRARVMDISAKGNDESVKEQSYSTWMNTWQLLENTHIPLYLDKISMITLEADGHDGERRCFTGCVLSACGITLYEASFTARCEHTIVLDFDKYPLSELFGKRVNDLYVKLLSKVWSRGRAITLRVYVYPRGE